MNINEVKELIELINASDLAYFEYENGDSRIKMDKSLTRNTESISNKEFKTQTMSKETEVDKIIKEEVKREKEEVNEIVGTIIASPMVGTFYESPSPDSESFVKLGDSVKKGQTLCIIEAMKLMNEIESEVSGKIVEVLVKDGDMVEYGTLLFKIEEDV